MDQAEEEAPLQDTFILGGQPWVYTEQPWDRYPDVANEAYEETRALLIRYWMAMHAGVPVIEAGVALTRKQLEQRSIELTAGLWSLAGWVPVLRPLRRALNSVILATTGILLPESH